MQLANYLKFAGIRKSERRLPNYLFIVGHENVGVRKFENNWKGSVTKERLGTTGAEGFKFN